MDPVTKHYESPYAAFGNNPIWNIDPNGADTSKYLSSKQTVDAIKIGYNVIKKRLDTKTYSAGGDYSKEIEAGITDYWKNNQASFSWGAAKEFREQTYEYVKGLKEVASAVDGANLFNGLGNKILYNKGVDNYSTVLATQKLINEKNGELGKVAGAGVMALGVAIGSAWGVQAGPGPRAPFVSNFKLPAGKDIALGVNENLPEFAKTVGGETWKTWGAINFPTRFTNVINNSSNRIHFNLTGPDGNQINVWKAVSEGAKGFQSSRATSWELYQLYNNPAAQARTTFYHNGSAIPNPF